MIDEIKEVIRLLRMGNLKLALAKSTPLNIDLMSWVQNQWKRHLLRTLRAKRVYVSLVKHLFKRQQNPKSQFAKWVKKMRKCSKAKGGRGFMSAPQDWLWTINNAVVNGADARLWLEGLLENIQKESRRPITRAQAILVIRNLAQAYKQYEKAINAPSPRYYPLDVVRALDPEGYAKQEAEALDWINEELAKLQ